MSAVPGRDPIVSAAGIGADPAKCQQVQDWPVPRDRHEVRSFVGLCSYYRRHIQGFMELAAPLYELATKGTDFDRPEARGFRPVEERPDQCAERERCCPKSRTKKNGSLPMSASRWREANRGTARPARSCWQ